VALRGFAAEAPRTLGLLMPPDDDCKGWFERQLGEHIDRAAGHQGAFTSRVRDYRFWRSRLLMLEKEF